MTSPLSFAALVAAAAAIIVLARTWVADRADRVDGGDVDRSRRSLIQYGTGAVAGLAGLTLAGRDSSAGDEGGSPTNGGDSAKESPDPTGGAGSGAGESYRDSAVGYMGAQGEVDHEFNGFDPMEMLVDWSYGETSELPDGRTLREYDWKAIDKEIEIAPGIRFPAWTYEGRVPGPTIRCEQGDRIRINFTNVGSHPHTIHFHGIHSFEMDGVPGAGPGEIAPGETFTYEFDAEPYGCHFYHCHSIPLKRHIHKGLYGAFIVDPPEGRPPARELLMLMNGFDTNFDSDNEIYAVNTVAHEFMRRQIPAKVGERIRIYLINALEFDLVNSFHAHAQFFDYYDHGTSLEPDRETVDTIMQTQAERGIIEIQYDVPGQFMFHAHQSEFAELGWMGKFDVVPPDDFDRALERAGVGPEWDRRARRGSTVRSD